MRIGRLLIFIVIALCISYFVVHNKLVSYEFFIETDFLFTFLGVFIGFALTLYTYLTSMFENLKKIINRKWSNDIKLKDEKLKLLPILHNEIKDNIIFLIYSLIIVVTIAIGNQWLIEYNQYYICNIGVLDLKNSVLLAIFILSVYSLKDLVITSFKISDFIVKN